MRRSSSSYPFSETPRAKAQLDQLAGLHPRFQDLWEGVLWLLSRKPDAGTLIPGKSETYVFYTIDFLALNLPKVRVMYSIVEPINPRIEFFDVTVS